MHILRRRGVCRADATDLGPELENAGVVERRLSIYAMAFVSRLLKWHLWGFDTSLSVFVALDPVKTIRTMLYLPFGQFLYASLVV